MFEKDHNKFVLTI